MVFVNFNTCFTDPQQLIRLIVLIICVCFTAYQLEECISKLLHPPFSTTYKMTSREAIEYPAVTICRKPQFNANASKEFGMSNIDLVISGAFNDFDFSKHNLTEFMKKVTYSYRDTILAYGFNSVVKNSNVSITSQYYVQLGNCHTFKTNESSSEYHMGGGFVFYLKNERSKPDGTGISSNGFNVFIHDPSDTVTDQKAQMDSYLQFIFVEPEEYLDLNLEKTEFRQLNKYQNPCVVKEDYSKSKCEVECIHRMLMDTYQCTTPWLRGKTNYPLCNNASKIEHLIAELNNHRQKYKNSCQSLCPSSCQLNFYNLKIMNRKKLAAYSVIYLYFKSNIVSVMEEKSAYDWNYFLSDLGGSLGLFLGLSVIGIIEIMEAMFALIFGKRQSKAREQEKIAMIKEQKIVKRLIEYILKEENLNDGSKNCKEKF